MKKLLLWVSSVPSMLLADDMASEMMDMVTEMPGRMADTMANLSWKMKLMIYWQMMSKVHKMIAVALLVVVVLFIVCKLFKCKKKCSCGCVGGSCKCH